MFGEIVILPKFNIDYIANTGSDIKINIYVN